MKKFFRWLAGSVEVKIKEGRSGEYCPERLPVERFLNLCGNRGLMLFSLKGCEGEYRFRMSLSDYWQIAPIAKKTGVLPLIERRFGLPFLVAQWKRKKLFAGGFLLFLCLTCLLTRMIWSIDITGCSYHTQEALLEYLEEEGVKCGIFYKNLDYKKIEDMLRLTYQDISWVSVERVGTKLHIRIQESLPILAGKNMSAAQDVLAEQDKSDGYSFGTQSVRSDTSSMTAAHLVASMDGIVESIITRSGTPMVKAGDTVKKGDILISGIVEVYGDGDALLNTHLVYADGDVHILGEEAYYSVREMEYEKKVYTGQAKWQFTLFGKYWWFDSPVLELPGSKILPEETDRFTERYRWSFSPSMRMPFSFGITTWKEYEIVRVRYSQEEAKKLEEKKFLDYVARFEKKGVVVRENHVTIEVGSTVCVAEGNVTVCQLEGKHQNLSEDKWRDQNINEYNGNDS